MSEENIMNMPCGCSRGIVTRTAPDFDDTGAPKLDAEGDFVMKEIEELQESYCAEHTKVLVERQHEVQRALESGASLDEFLNFLTDMSPLPALPDVDDLTKRRLRK